jgi:hypothetical protein
MGSAVYPAAGTMKILFGGCIVEILGESYHPRTKVSMACELVAGWREVLLNILQCLPADFRRDLRLK